MLALKEKCVENEQPVSHLRTPATADVIEFISCIYFTIVHRYCASPSILFSMSSCELATLHFELLFSFVVPKHVFFFNYYMH